MILIDKIEFEKMVRYLLLKVKVNSVEADIDILSWVKSEASEDYTGYLIDEKIIEDKIKELNTEKIKYDSFEEFDEVIFRSNQMCRLEWVFQISEPVVTETSKYETSPLAISIKDQIKKHRISLGRTSNGFYEAKIVNMDFNDESADFPNFHEQ